jgi:hypothetical protein
VLWIIVKYCIVDAKTRCRLRAVCRTICGMIIQSWLPIGNSTRDDVGEAHCHICQHPPATRAHGRRIFIHYHKYDATVPVQTYTLEMAPPTTVFVCSRKCLDDLCIGACIAWCEGDPDRMNLFQSDHDVSVYDLNLWYIRKPMVNLVPDRIFKRLRVK